MTVPSDIPSRSDLVELTKARLSIMVVVTTAAGFISGWTGETPFSIALLFHTVFGTILCAFGAAVFNQLMEIQPDKEMQRTADRPLPAGRIPPAGAFVIGWVLSAFGVVHLGVKVNTLAAVIAGLTLLVYIFVYTPLKRRSSSNTIVGAVAGALPPVIGWVGAGQNLDFGALWWFALLFLWQLPHFFAINWIYREEYQKGGFVMLANQDDDGSKTSRWAFIFAISLVLLAFLAPVSGITRWWYVLPGALAGGWLVMLALKFVKLPERSTGRRLFFGTLIYLPIVLVAALLAKP
ncbi:MAG: heme o synthase [Verrucomicrobiota bacterium]